MLGKQQQQTLQHTFEAAHGNKDKQTSMKSNATKPLNPEIISYEFDMFNLIKYDLQKNSRN